MSIKITAFLFELFRWAALVALALVPTIILVVAYRSWRGEPLWSMKDIPLAAEVTLCLAWLSLLMTLFEGIGVHLGHGVLPQLGATVAAALLASIPVAIGYQSIGEVRRMLSPAGPAA
jgi:hypothetical protein